MRLLFPGYEAVRRASWALPLLLALAFAASVAAWLRHSDAQDLEEERLTLIADTLTLEARISDWLNAEHAVVDRLATQLPHGVDDHVLLNHPAVAEGLRRLWVSVTVLDANNRVVAHVPQLPPQAIAPQPIAPRRERAGVSLDEGGVTAHWSADRPGGGRLVVRFAPTALLRQTLPWWLAQKYDVRLVDGLGQRLAQVGNEDVPVGTQSYRLSVDPAMRETWLELNTRDRHIPWWTTLAAALMSVFIVLSGLASAMLRRQMQEVRRAEGEARTEAAWRRAVEDSLTVGLRGRDLEGRVTHVNRAFCDLVGYSPEELLGSLPPMPYWLPDEMEDSLRRHQRNMAGGAPREGYEARWLRSDGRVIEVMIFEAPLVDAGGRQIGWMGSIVDISARKLAEERERRQTEALAHQARLSTLGEVASALAHQLNQPLAAIAGYNAGALRTLERGGPTDDMVMEALRRLGEQAAEAGRIVQRIRAFLTRRAPQPEVCAMSDIVARVLALLKRDLRGLRVEQALPADLPLVNADAVLIEQVLINLIRNAADELQARSQPGPRPHIRISAAAVGQRFVRVDVDDNGPGLQGRGIEQLTTAFYSTKPEGMGMGLAICRSVIEAHHGGMEAGTGPLGGARLSFTLPLVALAEGVAEDAAAPVLPSANKENTP
ncbi:two-component system, LuxR family, sensor histidine kinase DctS [Roseateles sp. YR242]|uniref:PAS domain-containing sensor histidine kinase n=1 Tax=Roseateles sp. YR242 TaxID=1855305 RepID=UPI0008CAA8DB|nr:PAS domain-containing sensor histidine kinase [Roseateles sp. YR242]SEL84334.1 two-component system, LuxR family, sensor histidine kinase DctS [Roseateles sp. YR242]